MTIQQMVRKVLEETALTEPTDVAEKILSMLTPDDYLPVLQETLPHYVGTMYTLDRMAPAVRPRGSAKVAGVREMWKRRLNTPVKVNGAWKRLGECDAFDLMSMADELRVLADKHLQKADYYEKIAAASGQVGRHRPLPRRPLLPVHPRRPGGVPAAQPRRPHALHGAHRTPQALRLTPTNSPAACCGFSQVHDSTRPVDHPHNRKRRPPSGQDRGRHHSSEGYQRNDRHRRSAGEHHSPAQGLARLLRGRRLLT